MHIENALTLKPEPNFELQVTSLRVIFEPILGILLFLNRSFYALNEIIILLYWFLGIFVLDKCVKGFKIKDKNQLKPFIIRHLLNLPVLIGLWFALFVILIFIPLHNDRIINHSKDWVLVGTHSHTEYSHDGMISQENLWKWHKGNGFDAFFITEHNNHNHTLDFVNHQKEKKIPGDPVVYCGEEFSGSNHLSLLGLKTKFSSKGLTDSAVVAKARADGAAIMVNHWFDGERKSLDYYRNLGADGFEIENTAEDKRYNREIYHRIRKFCEKYGLIMNGGLDFHGYASVCTLWNSFKIPGWEKMDHESKESAILNIIKNREQSKLNVLLLNDRPYYEKKNLFFRPMITLFQYFRTLNYLQFISWMIWIILITLLHYKLKSIDKLANIYTSSKILPISGVLASLFILILGLIYQSRIQDVEGFTEIYAEYSQILIFAGIGIFVLACCATWFNIFRKKILC